MRSSSRTVLFILVLVGLFSLQAFPQTDPDPNSPVPVISTASSSSLKTRTSLLKQNTLWPGRQTTVDVSVANVELMKGEEPNAFRVYLYQRSGKTFLLQVASASKTDDGNYSLKIRLHDADGYRGQPAADGESLLFITWRGLASNYLKVQLGTQRSPIKIPSGEPLSQRGLTEVPTNNAVGYRWAGDRIRFLEQAAFGPTTEADARLRRIGIRTWLAEQFDTPYPSYAAYPNPPQMPANAPSNCQLTSDHTCYRERYTMLPLQTWFFLEAFYGNAQLRHRVAWALSQIWVTSGVTTQQSSHAIAYQKILGNNAFGNYKDLMREATLSPTMGNYLDMIRSTKANPNENYPREILQLFSIGLYMLNQDGTVQTDSGGQPIPTYSQETINNFAKVMTGWAYCNNAGCPNASPGILNYKDPMVLVPGNHDLTAKTLLSYPNVVNQTIAACDSCSSDDAIRSYASQSLDAAITNIFNHPNVGPYIGKLLIQHMVTSDPSPAYVERVAGAFNNNGAGVRGDMKAVIRAILLDPEARGDLKTAPRYGKLREPIQLISNIARILPAKDYNGWGPTDGVLHSHAANLGQNPFYSPTVFNYFEPDFVIPGTTAIAPEFQLFNTGTTVKRTNFLYTLIFEGITPNATDSLRGTSLDLSEYVAYAQADATGNQLVDILGAQMLHGALSPEHKALVLSAVQAVPASDPILRTKTAVYLIASSLQYQVQR